MVENTIGGLPESVYRASLEAGHGGYAPNTYRAVVERLEDAGSSGIVEAWKKNTRKASKRQLEQLQAEGTFKGGTPEEAQKLIKERKKELRIIEEQRQVAEKEQNIKQFNDLTKQYNYLARRTNKVIKQETTNITKAGLTTEFANLYPFQKGSDIVKASGLQNYIIEEKPPFKYAVENPVSESPKSKETINRVSEDDVFTLQSNQALNSGETINETTERSSFVNPNFYRPEPSVRGVDKSNVDKFGLAVDKAFFSFRKAQREQTRNPTFVGSLKTASTFGVAASGGVALGGRDVINYVKENPIEAVLIATALATPVSVGLVGSKVAGAIAVARFGFLTYEGQRFAFETGKIIRETNAKDLTVIRTLGQVSSTVFAFGLYKGLTSPRVVKAAVLQSASAVVGTTVGGGSGSSRAARKSQRKKPLSKVQIRKQNQNAYYNPNIYRVGGQTFEKVRSPELKDTFVKERTINVDTRRVVYDKGLRTDVKVLKGSSTNLKNQPRVSITKSGDQFVSVGKGKKNIQVIDYRKSLAKEQRAEFEFQSAKNQGTIAKQIYKVDLKAARFDFLKDPTTKRPTVLKQELAFRRPTVLKTSDFVTEDLRPRTERGGYSFLEETSQYSRGGFRKGQREKLFGNLEIQKNQIIEDAKLFEEVRTKIVGKTVDTYGTFLNLNSNTAIVEYPALVVEEVSYLQTGNVIESEVVKSDTIQDIAQNNAFDLRKDLIISNSIDYKQNIDHVQGIDSATSQDQRSEQGSEFATVTKPVVNIVEDPFVEDGNPPPPTIFKPFQTHPPPPTVNDPNPIKPPTKIKNPPIPKFPTGFGEGNKRRGFNVFIRREGEFFQATDKPLSRAEALNFGTFKVGTTAAATFKLIPSSTRKLGSFSGSGNLADFYRKGDMFIEKRGRRIKSEGEKEEITFKGLQSLRLGRKKNKSLFGRGFRL